MDLWTCKDIHVLVVDIDVAQVELALCCPSYQILTALLHMADEDVSPASFSELICKEAGGRQLRIQSEEDLSVSYQINQAV